MKSFRSNFVGLGSLIPLTHLSFMSSGSVSYVKLALAGFMSLINLFSLSPIAILIASTALLPSLVSAYNYISPIIYCLALAFSSASSRFIILCSAAFILNVNL